MAVLLGSSWLQGQDLNLRPSGYEPDIFGFQPNEFPKGTEKAPERNNPNVLYSNLVYCNRRCASAVS